MAWFGRYAIETLYKFAIDHGYGGAWAWKKHGTDIGDPIETCQAGMRAISGYPDTHVQILG
jgi:hypothetical protein